MSNSNNITPGEIHQFRREIDALIQKAEASSNNVIGREMALIRTKLQEAKMWAGKCLEAMGQDLPKEFQDKYEL